MVENNLTHEMIQSGEILLTELDRKGARADAAFWLYLPESNRWRLMLIEAKKGKKGPREEYREIQRILAKLQSSLPQLKLEDISIVSSDSPILRILRSAIGLGAGISGIRFRNNVINGVLIEDAYLYRL